MNAWDEQYAQIGMTAGFTQKACKMMCEGGMLLYTDYSGADFPKEALRVMVPALVAAAGCEAPCVRFVRS